MSTKTDNKNEQNSVQELWYTEKDKEDHINNLNEQSEAKFHKNTADNLRTQIENALTPKSRKH